MNKLFVVLDGAADSLKFGKTPYEVAKKPNLDFMAKYGKDGLMYVIDKNIAPESDEAMIALLGFDPFKVYTGRGVLEAYGANVKFDEGDIVLRANFAFYKNNKLDVEIKPTKKELKEIVSKLNKINSKIKLIPTAGHRAVLIIKSKSSPRITNTHPGYKIIKNYVTTSLQIKETEKLVAPLEKNAKETAFLVNDFIKKAKLLLKRKRINTILLRGAGNKLPSLSKLENFCLLADMPVENAIGKLVGMQVIKKPDSLKKTAILVSILMKKSDVYIQLKGPDSFAHKGDFKGKVKAIEQIDKKFFGELFKRLTKKPIVIVCSDHATPVKLKAHSSDMVPVIVYGKDEFRDNLKFDEREFKKGSLGIIKGKDLFKIFEEL